MRISSFASFALIALVVTGCSVRCGSGGAVMDQRGAATWTVDGKPVQVDRTYFQASGDELAFVVEWTCPACARATAMTQDEALVLSKPVLWHAIESGEVARTAVKINGTAMLVTRMVAIVRYPQGSGQGETSVRATAASLADWTWTVADRSYHVVTPGYFVDGSGALYFTVAWLAPELCDAIAAGIDDVRAGTEAMPVMKEVVRRKLFETIKPPLAPGGASRAVDRIGVAITCARDCAPGAACDQRGYRVGRSLAEIAAAP
jgi:hypothetical protein